MNNVVAYKQFGLGEGLADLFASEVKNFGAFKASLASKVKMFRDTLGYENCGSDWKDSGDWKKSWNQCS